MILHGSRKCRCSINRQKPADLRQRLQRPLCLSMVRRRSTAKDGLWDAPPLVVPPLVPPLAVTAELSRI
jgi:hypothetical protein